MPIAAVKESSSAYDRLKELILDGRFAAGAPLTERALATELGVSRTPVREAILGLEKEGLVQIIDGRGAFVASYSVEDVIQIYHVRIGLEPLAARLSCANISTKMLDTFERELERFKQNPDIRKEDPDAWRRIGRDFHGLFIRASGSGRLIQILDGLRDQIELVRGWGRLVAPDASHRSTIDEHLNILQALKARDPDRAEAAVRTHLDNGLKYRLGGLHLP
jgi:DNA-binding GntR family transcriptional regulator